MSKYKKVTPKITPVYNPSLDDFHISKAAKKNTGKFAIPLTKEQIIDAQLVGKSAAECARILGVALPTYTKYAKKYGLYENVLNQSGKGTHKRYVPGTTPWQRYNLDDILKGMYPDYPINRLKDRLIKSGYLEEKCHCCGFEERRISDYKVPLLLDFLDGNRKNLKYENLAFICFNCSFLTNGNLTGIKKDINLDN